jgi:hypothetical protein
LSALQGLLEDLGPSDPRPRLIVARETLGRLETIFPEIADWRIDREETGRRGVRNEPGTFFVNLGGYRISSKLRARIVGHAQDSASAPTLALIAEVRE